MFDWIGHMCVSWSEEVWPGAGPEVPDERPGSGAQHSADLGQSSRRVGPMVHRQSADDQVERSVGERQRSDIADQKRRPALVAVLRMVGVGSGALDHGWIEVDTGHIEAVLVSQPDR